MIFALALLFFGATATSGRPNSIMVNYEGTTTFPPMVNFMDNSPNPNIIHLRYDKDTQAEMLARDPSYWVQRSLSWNNGGNDDNSTLHIEPPSNDDGQDRIVGGQPASDGQLPMMAKLLLEFEFGGFLCGSTIITSQWLLTAAHCIISNNGFIKSIMVRAGTVNSDSGGQIAYASMYITHPNYIKYDSTPSGYDIALVKLSNPLTLNNLVQAAWVKQLPNPSAGAQLTAAGWGITENGSTSPVLKSANLTVATCPDNFVYPNLPSGTGSLVCTNAKSGNTCSGDSGGFVGHQHPKGFYVVDGIHSFGPAPVNGVCPTSYSVQTSVAFYLDWIINAVNSN